MNNYLDDYVSNYLIELSGGFGLNIILKKPVLGAFNLRTRSTLRNDILLIFKLHRTYISEKLFGDLLTLLRAPSVVRASLCIIDNCFQHSSQSYLYSGYGDPQETPLHLQVWTHFVF